MAGAFAMLRGESQSFTHRSVGGVRHAYGVSHLTGAETALLSAAVGGGIALVSNWLGQRTAARSARADARSLAIQETLAAADDLLFGVQNFRIVRGRRTVRSISTGFQHALKDHEKLPDGTSLSPVEKIAMGLITMTGAAAAGGVLDQEMERDAAQYQAMVGPPRQRLNAAASRLRTDRDRRLADAVDRLAASGAKYADAASALPLGYKHAKSTYEKRIREFRGAAELRRRRRLLRRS
jgi:hypothetical protein